MKDFLISDIEALTEKEAQELALDVEIIKGFNVYFIDFGGYFKYSAIVYGNAKQIKYANEYELHYTHMDWSREKLHDEFIKRLKNKLFTEKELAKPVKNYNDYEAKRYFLANYFSLQYDYISIFFIGSDEERAELKKKTETMFFSKTALAYFQDESTVDKIEALADKLNEEREKVENSYKYIYSAVLKELWNHEYIINYQGDWDVFECFGPVVYGSDKGAAEYMQELKWTDEQKRAFYDARAEYLKKAREYC